MITSNFKNDWPIYVILHHIRPHIDRRARIVKKKGIESIHYNLCDYRYRERRKDPKTNKIFLAPKFKKMVLDKYQITHIFHEVYPPDQEGKLREILITEGFLIPHNLLKSGEVDSKASAREMEGTEIRKHYIQKGIIKPKQKEN